MHLIRLAKPAALAHSRGLWRARAAGFTLLEVMVALVITAIGLLGIAKIQALAYSSTGAASMRSLVAIQAAGLAASMHADRSYWANGLAPVSITITGGSGTSFTISDGYLNTTASTANFCQSGGGGAPCSASQLASYDLRTWATALSSTGMLANMNPITTIACPVAIPVNCTITVTWTEKAVSINSQSAANTSASTASSNPSYMLYVEP